MAVNGKIIIGLGAALMAWGAVAFSYGQNGTGAALLLLGIAVFVLGRRQSRKGL